MAGITKNKQNILIFIATPTRKMKAQEVTKTSLDWIQKEKYLKK